VVPSHCDHPAHLFYLLLPTPQDRQGLIAHLRALAIQAVFHYQPLHLSDFGRNFGGQPGDCPVTEDVSDRLLRLPVFYDLTPEDQERIIAGVSAYRTSLAGRHGGTTLSQQAGRRAA
jgi:dTDP-4-amino-4,6-dideoxygalactose transaminase